MATSFYITGGTLDGEAPSYVERKADEELARALVEGEFCYVLTSRQMGKSSLMVRTAQRLRERGIAVVALDLTGIGGQTVNADQWYYGLLDLLGEQLGLERELEAFWGIQANLSPLQRLMKALRQVVLPRLNEPPSSPFSSDRPPSTAAAAGGSPEAGREDGGAPGVAANPPTGGAVPAGSAASVRLVVFIDEIDSVLSLPFRTDDFFAAIRECYNHRTRDPVYGQLTFCLLGVATPSDLIQDPRTTPFNIGRRIELSDFTPSEALPLAHGLVDEHGDAGLAVDRLKRVLYWTGGHPYLTQRLCRAVAQAQRGEASAGLVRWGWRPESPARLVDRLCAEIFFSHRAYERDDNLIFVRERLLRSGTDVAGILDLYLKVWRGKRIPDDDADPLVGRLRLAGIVRCHKGRLVERNRIYGHAFNRRWTRWHMPAAELRRQREAYLRGVVYATAVSAAILAGVAALAWAALRNSARAYFAQAEALRLSGRAGQRIEGLAALRKAVRFHPDRFALRTEAVSLMALRDLAPAAELIPSSPNRGPVVLEPNFARYAEAAADGTIAVRWVRSGKLTVTLPPLGAPVRQMIFAEGGPYLAVDYAQSGGSQTTVWDWGTGEPVLRSGQGALTNALAFRPDARQLVLATTNGESSQLSFHGLAEDRMVQVPPLTLETNYLRLPTVLRYHPSGTLVAECAPPSLEVRFWDPGRGLVESRYYPDAVHDVAWSPDGATLAVGCADQTVYLEPFPATNGLSAGAVKPVAYRGHESVVRGVAFSHGGEWLASLGADLTLRLWDLRTDRALVVSLNDDRFERVQFSLNDRYLVLARRDGHDPQIWRLAGGEYRLLARPNGQTRPCLALDFSPDRLYVAAADSESITIWRTDEGRRVGVIDVEAKTLNAMCFEPEGDGGTLLLTSNQGFERRTFRPQPDRRWPTVLTQSAEPVSDLPTGLGPFALASARNQATVVHQNQLLILDLRRPQELRRITTGVHYPALAVSSDGRWAAALAPADPGSEKPRLAIWSLGSHASTPAHEEFSTEHFGFSPDGQWLVTCWTNAFRFHRVGRWKELPQMAIQRSGPRSESGPFAFSPDGAMIAVAHARAVIWLYALEGARAPRPRHFLTLQSPEAQPIRLLSFSRDGRYLAAATESGFVQLWDLARVREGLVELRLGHGVPDFTVTQKTND